ncbi:molecular chaperone DnaK [Tolypothrix sp. FACHB-123]|nr:molecular chaperone DnaK [Tolypothrix sp. FACHB-123]
MIGQTLGQRYNIIQLLGKGGFGETYLAEDLYIPVEPKPRCVVKRLCPQVIQPDILRLFETEAKTLYNLGQNHEQIPKLLAYFEQNGEFYLIQEFIEGHDLGKELTPGKILSEPYTIKLLQNVLEVLAFVHQNNVIHRDIKPSNIMRRKPGGKLILIDFGAVKQAGIFSPNISGQTSLSVSIGTPGYMPSEQALGKPRLQSDIYALGMVAIQALTGIPPHLLSEDDDGELLWQNRVQISDDLASILTKMVRYDWRQRYANAGDVLQTLNETLQSSVPPTILKPPQPSQSSVPPNSQSHVHSSAFKHQHKQCANIIGIDLGTTKAVMAVMADGKPVVIPNEYNSLITFSVVAYGQNSDILVGQAAKTQALKNPQNTFDSVINFIGCEYDEITKELIEKVFYKIVNNAGKPNIECPITRQLLTAEEILAHILSYLQDCASKYTGHTNIQAVVTVPAYFNDIQCNALKNAAKITKLEILRIIRHPLAVALAYGWNKKDNETILIFDLGAAQLSISTLIVEDGVFEVLSYSGDKRLGGSDFDRQIVDYLIENFREDEGVDLRQDRQAIQRLTEAAEKAKLELSSATQTEINLPYIVQTNSGYKHLNISLTRDKFAEICADLISRCHIPLENSLRDSKLSKSDIDAIIMVGGSSRIPAIQELIRNFFNKEPNLKLNSQYPAALGAAIQAGILSGDMTGILPLDALPLSLGVETLGGVMTKIILRNTTIPTKKSEVFSTTVDGQTKVEIHILQGEREFANDNKSLGGFCLDGIPSAPRGVPQIEVTFDIDANSLLCVIAKDKGTGKEESICITHASRIYKQEVGNFAINFAIMGIDTPKQK